MCILKKKTLIDQSRLYFKIGLKLNHINIWKHLFVSRPCSVVVRVGRRVRVGRVGHRGVRGVGGVVRRGVGRGYRSRVGRQGSGVAHHQRLR